MNYNPEYTFTEIFPINVEKIPKLYAFSMNLGGGEPYRIGGKLSYRLGKDLGGTWIYSDYKIVTDQKVSDDDVQKAIESLWTSKTDDFRHIQNMKREIQWKPSPYAVGSYVRRYVDNKHGKMIRQLLSKSKIELNECNIKRVHEIRNWVVDGSPALSTSVRSRLVHKKDLYEYSKRTTNQKLEGLWVADKNTTLKDVIFDVVGKLGEHRKRLLQLTQNEKTIEILEKSPDDVPVVSVGRNQYYYAATCLVPIIRSENYSQFGIDARKVNRNLTIGPSERYNLVYRISRTIIGEGWFDFEYNSKRDPNLFLMPEDVGFSPYVKIGNDTIVKHDRQLFFELKKNGPYKYAETFASGKPIQVGAILGNSVKPLDEFYNRLEQELSSIGFDVEIVKEIRASSSTRSELERCVIVLEEESPDIILGVFGQDFEYDTFKRVTLGKGIVSQIVLTRTLENRYALPNIVMGIIGKTGNTPFILADPMPYTDIIVGIDVAREKKKKLSGTINVAALARIFFSDGQFVRYVIHDEPIEGETIPVSVLQSMFPRDEFEGRRVILHRDGVFRGNEVQTLNEWSSEIGATIHPVEVMKSGAPRLYGAGKMDPAPKDVGWPQVGAAMRMDSNSALIVTTLPVSKNSTPQPLRITSKSNLSIEDALHSVLSLKLLHYGSIRQPRLPVTVHYSDDIAGLALRGIKPKELSGNRPYWL
ncbi:MAG: Piwi domain-containing protein [Candidatus Thorarchaeota archaeon]